MPNSGIQWAGWDYRGGNGLRIGGDVYVDSVDHNSTVCNYHIDWYVQTQYNFRGDAQTLGIYNFCGGSFDYTLNSAGGDVTYIGTTYGSYAYTGADYGSGVAMQNYATASIDGAYNGSTGDTGGQWFVTVPQRPIAPPQPPTNLVSRWNSDTSSHLNWNNYEGVDAPTQTEVVYLWDNISNGWNVIWSGSPSAIGDLVDVRTSAGRRYSYAVQASNTSGNSATAYSGPWQTTPAGPSGITATASGISGYVVQWTNNQGTTNGYDYSSVLECSVNGGAWTQIANISANSSTPNSFAHSGLNPGSTYAYRVKAHDNLNGHDSSYVTSSTYRLMGVPADPSGLSVTRTSDTSYTLSWTNGASTSSNPYSSVVVQRLDYATGVWTTVMSDSTGTTTSVTDTGTVANKSYQWRVAAHNAAGYSNWLTSAKWQTTPAAPTNVTASWVPGGVQFSWTNSVPANYDYSLEIEYWVDGALNSSTIPVAQGSTSYVLGSPVLTSTYRFGVRARSTQGTNLDSAYVTSATIAAVPPNAPTNLSPNSGYADLNAGLVLKWKHNAGADYAPISKFEVQYRVQGTSTWTSSGVITSTQSQYTLPSDAFTASQVMEWQVRDYGASTTASPWSASAVVTGSTTPTITVTSPVASWGSSHATVTWSYSQAQGSAQAQYSIQLLDNLGGVLEEHAAAGSATSVALTTTLLNHHDYTLTVTAQAATGQWTATTTINMTVVYVPPVPSVLVASYDSTTGSTLLTLNPGTVTTGYVPAISCDIQRQIQDANGSMGPWITIASGLATNASITDTLSPIAGDGSYRAITYSDTPSSYVGPSVSTTPDGQWLFLSGGPNFTSTCRMYGNVSIKATFSRERQLYHFAGRELPVMFLGEAIDSQLSITGLIDIHSSTPAEWKSLVQTCGVMFLRDYTGHRYFVSVDSIQIDPVNNQLWSVQFNAQEVSYP